MFSSPTIIGILLLGKSSYQADFINYKNNSLGKVINETFWQKGPQQELLMAQALGQKMMLTLQRLINKVQNATKNKLEIIT